MTSERNRGWAYQERNKSIEKTTEAVLGPNAKKRVRRFGQITLAVAIATELVSVAGFSLNPSEAHIVQVSGFVTQLAGILIGFEAIAVFYFLAAIGSQRGQILQLLSGLTVNPFSIVDGEKMKEDLVGQLFGLDKLFAMTSRFMVDMTVYSIVYFAGSVFFAMFSVVFGNDILLGVGIALLVAGISGIIISIREVHDMQDLITQVLSVTAGLISSTVAIADAMSRLSKPERRAFSRLTRKLQTTDQKA